jgi:hypothetical protein
MAYKVIKELGEHKVGSIVSNEYGETVLKMYSTPHVEKIIEEQKSELELPVTVVVPDINADGKVDAKDVAIVNKDIAKEVKKVEVAKKKFKR